MISENVLVAIILSVVTLIGTVLTFITARNTASYTAVTALSEAVETLRGELNAEREARKKDKAEFELMIADEKKERIEERKKYKAYIDLLVESIEKAGLEVPSFDQ